jgi:hypothetical protein
MYHYISIIKFLMKYSYHIDIWVGNSQCNMGLAAPVFQNLKKMLFKSFKILNCFCMYILS